MQKEEAEGLQREFQDMLEEEQVVMRAGPPRKRGMKSFSGVWKGLHLHWTPTDVDTSVPRDVLKKIAEHLTTVPDGFNLNPKIARLLETRRNDFLQDKPVDWAFAEALAFGRWSSKERTSASPGQDYAPRHVQPAACHAGRRQDRRALRAAELDRAGSDAVHRL